MEIDNKNLTNKLFSTMKTRNDSGFEKSFRKRSRSPDCNFSYMDRSGFDFCFGGRAPSISSGNKVNQSCIPFSKNNLNINENIEFSEFMDLNALNEFSEMSEIHDNKPGELTEINITQSRPDSQATAFMDLLKENPKKCVSNLNTVNQTEGNLKQETFSSGIDGRTGIGMLGYGCLDRLENLNIISNQDNAHRGTISFSTRTQPRKRQSVTLTVNKQIGRYIEKLRKRNTKLEGDLKKCLLQRKKLRVQLNTSSSLIRKVKVDLSCCRHNKTFTEKDLKRRNCSEERSELDADTEHEQDRRRSVGPIHLDLDRVSAMKGNCSVSNPHSTCASSNYFYTLSSSNRANVNGLIKSQRNKLNFNNFHQFQSFKNLGMFRQQESGYAAHFSKQGDISPTLSSQLFKTHQNGISSAGNRQLNNPLSTLTSLNLPHAFAHFDGGLRESFSARK